MPTSWTQNFYHAVWSTKNRQPLIDPQWEPRLHAFIGGIIKEQECTPYAINGIADHVHVLFRFPSKLAISSTLKHIKFRSSRFVHEEISGMKSFDWQEGYGGFTISKTQVPSVRRYIERQKEHHKTMTFEEEFLGMLRKLGWKGDPSEVFK